MLLAVEYAGLHIARIRSAKACLIRRYHAENVVDGARRIKILPYVNPELS